jgi:hypothetical protein
VASSDVFERQAGDPQADPQGALDGAEDPHRQIGLAGPEAAQVESDQSAAEIGVALGSTLGEHLGDPEEIVLGAGGQDLTLAGPEERLGPHAHRGFEDRHGRRSVSGRSRRDQKARRFRSGTKEGRGSSVRAGRGRLTPR